MRDVVILSISGFLFVFGVTLWIKNTRLLINGKRATARILGNVKSTGASSVVWYPIVEFSVEKDKTTSQQLPVGFSPAQEIGSEMQIIFNPDDYSDITINNKLFLILLPRLLSAVGLTGLIAAILNFMGLVDIFPNS